MLDVALLKIEASGLKALRRNDRPAPIGCGLDTDLAHGLELELALVAEHMRSSDAAEGLRAFAEKRTPVFRSAERATPSWNSR